jgi:hypothetical protein
VALRRVKWSAPPDRPDPRVIGCSGLRAREPLPNSGPGNLSSSRARARVGTGLVRRGACRLWHMGYIPDNSDHELTQRRSPRVKASQQLLSVAGAACSSPSLPGPSHMYIDTAPQHQLQVEKLVRTICSCHESFETLRFILYLRY